MFDAAGAATGAEAAIDAVAEAEAILHPATAMADDHDSDLSNALHQLTPTENRKEVVIVDPSVPDHETLLDGMDPNVEVIFLEPRATISDVATAQEG